MSEFSSLIAEVDAPRLVPMYYDNCNPVLLVGTTTLRTSPTHILGSHSYYRQSNTHHWLLSAASSGLVPLLGSRLFSGAPPSSLLPTWSPLPLIGTAVLPPVSRPEADSVPRLLLRPASREESLDGPTSAGRWEANVRRVVAPVALNQLCKELTSIRTSFCTQKEAEDSQVIE